MPKTRILDEKESLTFRREIEASPSFKAVQTEMVRASQAHRTGLKKRMDDNAEYQRRKAMPQEEKTRGAIDRMAKGIKEFNEKARGKILTDDQCQAEARRIAKKALGQDM